MILTFDSFDISVGCRRFGNRDFSSCLIISSARSVDFCHFNISTQVSFVNGGINLVPGFF